VAAALVNRGLLDAYRARPPYQRNDSVGWILRAKQRATQERRLAQMLGEAPLHARAHNIPQTVEDFPQRVHSLREVFRHQHQVGRNERPLVITYGYGPLVLRFEAYCELRVFRFQTQCV
jgi:hypothetical protein